MQTTLNKPFILKNATKLENPSPFVRVSVESASEKFRSNRWHRIGVLAIGDILAVVTAFLLALLLSVFIRAAFGFPEPRHLISDNNLLSTLAVPIFTIAWFSSSWGHYIRIKPYWTEARELLKIVAYSGALAIVCTFLVKGDVSRLQLGLTISMLMLFAPVYRLFGKSILIRLNRWFVPLIVVGDGECLKDSIRAIESDQSLGYRVAAKIEIRSDVLLTEAHRNEIAENILLLAEQYHRPRLLLAFEHSQLLDAQEALVDQVSSNLFQVIVGLPMQGLSAINAEVLAIDKFDTLFIRLSANGSQKFSRLIKRIIDLSAASLALIIISPVLLIIAGLLLMDRGSIIYGSKRIGRNGRAFACLKFRTMHTDAEVRLAEMLSRDQAAAEEWASSFKLRNDPRITKLGMFLRRTSLDELPQFWNVLKGEMSIVGPRPILPQEVDSYGASAISLYQSVRPGLTGLWQISGRSDLPYAERIALNQWYLRNWSHWLDFSIILRTLPALLGRDEAR